MKPTPELRCRVTGNMSGTDTWMEGRPCQCLPCQLLVAKDELESAQAVIRYCAKLKNNGYKKVAHQWLSQHVGKDYFLQDTETEEEREVQAKETC